MFTDVRRAGIMGELQLALTAEEREFLVGLLENVLHDTRIEEHRTRAPSYRKLILNQEDRITGLLRKLGKPPG
jgi:hypothetical protein